MVQLFDAVAGFGFVVDYESGERFYVYASALQGPAASVPLVRGQHVEYTPVLPERNDSSLVAKRVTRVFLLDAIDSAVPVSAPVTAVSVSPELLQAHLR